MKHSFSFKGISVIACFRLGVFTGYCVHLPMIGYTKYHTTKTKQQAKNIINNYHKG